MITPRDILLSCCLKIKLVCVIVSEHELKHLKMNRLNDKSFIIIVSFQVLLFSQMTKLLDILEDFCYLRSYSHCRLDGTMKIDDRRDQIESFNTDPEVKLLYISLIF